VEQLLSQPPLSNARVAMQVESLDDGQVIYSRNPDELLNPASNTKLVTAAAGLLRLGPEYRFNTDYLSDKPEQRTPGNAVREGARRSFGHHRAPRHPGG